MDVQTEEHIGREGIHKDGKDFQVCWKTMEACKPFPQIRRGDTILMHGTSPAKTKDYSWLTYATETNSDKVSGTLRWQNRWCS